MAIKWKAKREADTPGKNWHTSFAEECHLAAAEGRSGRPLSGKKVVSIRLDPDIIERFRSTGPGWQARMNEALRKAMP